MLINNNKGFQTMTAKNAPSNNDAIYALENSELFSSITCIKCLCNCKSKHINKNKDNNKYFDFIILTKCLYGYKNKHVD